MLCGLGLLRKDHARRTVAASRYPQQLRENAARYLQFRDHILSTAISQAEAIQYTRSLK